MKPVKIPTASLGLLTLVYLALPLLIFFAFWLRPVYAIVAAGPLLFCGQYLACAWPVATAAFRRGDIAFAAVFGLALTAFVGIGGLAPQQYDWGKHNAVLFDCVHLPWPVILPAGSHHWPLVYYLAWYLPAAAVGKMAGYPAAEAALWVWSALGVMLACLWFARLTGLSVRVAAPAFFGFSGLDSVGDFLVQILGIPNRNWGNDFYPNQAWSGIWQFPSHFWMLDWAPGQALAGWLAAGMFLRCPPPLQPASFVFLLTCTLLWSPFVSVGLCLLAFFLILQEGLALPKPLAPILALILPLCVLLAFYTAKMSPEVAAGFPAIPIGWFTQSHYSPGAFQAVARLLLFSLLEFGIFLWFICLRFPKGSGERKLAWACGLALLCLLPVTVGYFSDLSMRGPTVPWFCLAVLLARTLLAGGLAPQTRDWFRLVILLACLTPFSEVIHVGAHIFDRRYYHQTTPERVSAVVNLPDGFLYWGGQYVGSTNSFFFRTLAR